jgi:hypothetical protein
MDIDTRFPARTGTTAGSSTGAVAQTLPLPLPFDDGCDDAVPFVLTAAAHREVLGRDIPRLAVVPQAAGRSAVGPGTTAGPGTEIGTEGGPAFDTRRVQARALLRSGMPIATIAAALDVAGADVERWTHDLGDELARRRRRLAARRPVTSMAVADAGSPVLPARPISDRTRLLPGLAFAIAEVDESGVALVHDDVEVVAVLLDAVRGHVDLAAGRVRVAVRLSPDIPADHTRTLIAERLGIDATSIIVGRAGSGAGRAIELRVDVRDAAAAQFVSALRDGGPLGMAVESA